MKPKHNLLLFLAVFIAGECVGGSLRRLFPGLQIWDLAFVTHGIGLTEGSFGRIFTEELICPMLWLWLFALIGLTLYAVPMAILLVFLHGMTIGEVLTGLYAHHALNGFLTAVTFVVPYAGLQTLLFLVAAKEAVRSSRSLQKAVFSREGETTSPQVYLLRFLVLSAGIVLLAVSQAFFGSKLYPTVIRRLLY